MRASVHQGNTNSAQVRERLNVAVWCEMILNKQHHNFRTISRISQNMHHKGEKKLISAAYFYDFQLVICRT